MFLSLLMGTDSIQFHTNHASMRQVQIIDLVELVDEMLVYRIPAIVKQNVTEQIAELREQLKQVEHPLEDGDLENYEAHCIERDIAAFPTALFSALFVTGYHFFEHDLNELCRLVESERGAPKFADFKDGKGIQRAKEYLRKAGGLNFPSDSANWHKIVSYGRVRNLIAHNGGRLDESQPSKVIAPFIEKTPTVAVKDDGEIVFSRAFVVDAADCMYDFWLDSVFREY